MAERLLSLAAMVEEATGFAKAAEAAHRRLSNAASRHRGQLIVEQTLVNILTFM